MSSFQSALMSWRDKGFGLDHLDSDSKQKVLTVIWQKSMSPCSVIYDNVINEIQRVEQSMRDRGAVFYSDDPPTVFDKHLNVIDMSEYKDRWVRVVGRESLTSLDELESFLDSIKR